jgi:hypothetical protein
MYNNVKLHTHLISSGAFELLCHSTLVRGASANGDTDAACEDFLLALIDHSKVIILLGRTMAAGGKPVSIGIGIVLSLGPRVEMEDVRFLAGSVPIAQRLGDAQVACTALIST